MHLEEVSVFRWTYDADIRVPAPGYALLSPYKGEEAIGYGESSGNGQRTDRGRSCLVELPTTPQ